MKCTPTLMKANRMSTSKSKTKELHPRKMPTQMESWRTTRTQTMHQRLRRLMKELLMMQLKTQKLVNQMNLQTIKMKKKVKTIRMKNQMMSRMTRKTRTISCLKLRKLITML